MLKSLGYSGCRFVSSLLNDTANLVGNARYMQRFASCFICILFSLLRCLVCFVFSQDFFRFGKNDKTMKLFEEGMELLRGQGNEREQAWMIKAARDAGEVLTKTGLFEELDVKTQKLVYFLLPAATLRMAQCGLVEEEKHSSIVYAEEHADELFDDRGANFFNMWKEAVSKAALEQEKRKEMERMVSDGNIEGQMRILKDMENELDKLQFECAEGKNQTAARGSR